nr:hypothetical protein [Tanacetum cinerariifolium]
MEQYLALSRENQAPGVVKPEIRGNVNFEIKSQFMQELREDTFSENKDEDVHDHIDRVLNIVSLFNILRVSHDAVLLRVFLFTLTGSAKRWVDRLTPGAVNTWDLLKKAFIQKYCPSSKAAKRIENIHNFKQESDESLYQAWERSNGAKFCVGPPGYYTRTDNRPPYGEKRPSLEELMNKHQEESIQRSAEMKEWITNGAPSSSTRQCKVVNANHETLNIPISSSKLNNLHGVSFLSGSDSQVINCFEEALDHDKDPMKISFDDYKWVFDLEIKQLVDEYGLGIGKKGHILDMIWEKCKNIQGKAKEWWFKQLGSNFRDRLDPQLCGSFAELAAVTAYHTWLRCNRFKYDINLIMVTP